jgi:hypothetical protein
MIKTKRDVLEDLWNETLKQVVDSEVKITLLKSKPPDEVMDSKKEMVMNRLMVRDITAKMLLEKSEANWRGQVEVLEIIKNLLAEQKDDGRN